MTRRRKKREQTKGLDTFIEILKLCKRNLCASDIHFKLNNSYLSILLKMLTLGIVKNNNKECLNIIKYRKVIIVMYIKSQKDKIRNNLK